MLKVLHISEINTKEMFETKQYMLGDNTGEWFVVDDDVYLGRYVSKEDAEEHVQNLSVDEIDQEDLSVEALKKALKQGAPDVSLSKEEIEAINKILESED